MKLFRCLLLLFSLLLSLTLLACGTDKIENPAPPFPPESGIETADPVPEHYTDMDEFIATLTTAEAAKAQPGAIGTTLEMTQVPILQAEGYALRLVENLTHQYIYYFVLEEQVNAHPIDIKTALIVHVAKSNLTYQSSIEQSDLQDQNGFAYYEKYNEWYINFDGKRVNIDFPDDIVLTSPEQIADYFTFETYYYTVPTDSGAVTE